MLSKQVCVLQSRLYLLMVGSLVEVLCWWFYKFALQNESITTKGIPNENQYKDRHTNGNKLITDPNVNINDVHLK